MGTWKIRNYIISPVRICFEKSARVRHFWAAWLTNTASPVKGGSAPLNNPPAERYRRPDHEFGTGPNAAMARPAPCVRLEPNSIRRNYSGTEPQAAAPEGRIDAVPARRPAAPGAVAPAPAPTDPARAAGRPRGVGHRAAGVVAFPV